MTDKHFWGSALRLLESIDRRLEAIERSKLALMKDSAIQRIEGLLVNRVGKERASIPCFPGCLLSLSRPCSPTNPRCVEWRCPSSAPTLISLWPPTSYRLTLIISMPTPKNACPSLAFPETPSFGFAAAAPLRPAFTSYLVIPTVTLYIRHS